MLTQKGIERFNESRFKSRKVKGRATTSENRKFFVAVMEGTLGIVKKMLTNGGFVKLLWAYVVLARAGKTLAVGRGTRIGDGFRNVLLCRVDCNNFFIQLNSLHPSLRFTYEKESNHSLPFLDVLVERHDSEFLTSVYRKPTFTGQYLRWNSFSPQKRKINLIGTLVHRAFMICSKSKLDQELGKIRSILLENGYPERVINSAFKRKLQQINSNPVHTVKKCPVYLHIPWIGNVSMRFEKQITSAVKRCFFSVEPRVIFNTRQLLPAIKKDVLPSHHHSNVIYQFLCHCDSRYVGRTSQRLEERIKQHVPKSITNPRTSANRQSLSRSCKNNIRP